MTPPRLTVVPPPPDKPRWWQGWAPALLIVVLVGGLGYTSRAARNAGVTIRERDRTIATQTTALDYLSQERVRLLADIERLSHLKPTEIIIVEPCRPPKPRPKRVVPVFSRDSQFSGVTR